MYFLITCWWWWWCWPFQSLTKKWCSSLIICLVCVVPKTNCLRINKFLSSIDAAIIISSQISRFPSAPVAVVPRASIAPPPVTVLISPPRSNPGKVVMIRRYGWNLGNKVVGFLVMDGYQITSISILTGSSSFSPGELIIEISVALSSVGEISPPIRTL